MSDVFRLGIVGAGRIAAEAHLPAALCCSGIEVTALVDTCRQRCCQLAARFGIIPRLAVSVDEVLNDMDGAVIATPNHTHHELALRCMAAGVHVLVEKPLAITVREGEQMVAGAEEAGVTLAVGCSTRFRPAVMLMTELLESKYFGRIKRFAYQFGTRGGWTPVSDYILERRAIGGGVTMVVGTHFLDRMLHWFGYPEQVRYEDDSQGGPEANARATFAFGTGPGRLEGSMRLSKTVSLPPGMVMDTEEGLVVLDDVHDASPIVVRPRGHGAMQAVLGPRPDGRAGSQNPYQRQLANFVDACRGRQQLEVTAREGVQSLRLIEAMYACRRPMPEARPPLEKN